MAYTPAKKSSYTKQPASSARNSKKAGDAGTSTTHYAYMLVRDDEGNVLKDAEGKTMREYVNNMVIFENETEHGTYLKVKVVGPIPEGDVFVMKKRAK